MRADALNSHVYPVRTEMTALSLHIYSKDEDKWKGIIVHETLSQSCSTDGDESKRIIVNETLLQKCSTEEDELCSPEEGKSKFTIAKKKDANNEVTYDVPDYFNALNAFKCGRKLLDRLDVSYERSYMATPREEYFTEMLDHKNEYN